MRVFFRRPCHGVLGTARPVRPSFRDPRFGCFVAGEAVNSIGGWASAIVLWGFAAYRFNASPYAVSVTIVCWAAPPAVLSPLLGVYVDRLGPKRALVAGYVAAALGMAAAGSLLQLGVAAAAYGLARALAGPAASALQGSVCAGCGQLPVGAAVVLPLTARPADSTDRPGRRHELGEGITFMARQPGLRLVTLITAAVSLTSGAFLVVEPLYARLLLHRPPSQFASSRPPLASARSWRARAAVGED